MVVFLLSCGCERSVSLPRSAVGLWSVIVAFNCAL